jgi:hypothetical protein
MAWASLTVGAVLCAASLGGLLFAGQSAPAGASGPCPADATCATMPGGVGTVTATPTNGLSNDEWVDLKFSGFNPGVKVYVFWCTNTKPLSAGAPACVSHGTADLLNPYTDVVTFSNGADSGQADIPFQVAESSSAVPFQGLDGLGATVPVVCDGTAANPCAIVLQQPSLGGKSITPTDAVVIPVTFATATGCASAQLMATESEYGIERLLPAVAEQACSGSSSPTLPFNTAIDGASAVEGLAAGDVPIAFTDDPQAPDEQAALKSIKGGYALIPVALSANVVGFRSVVAELSGVSQLFTRTSYSVTPTQVAGLISALYGSPTSSDLLQCDTPSSGGWCADPDTSDCTGNLCSVMSELNADPGFLGPQEYGVAVRSDASGVTHQMFEWLCNAPNTSFSLYGVGVSEPQDAASVLVNGFNTNLPPGDAPYKSCPSNSDTFPSLQSAGTQYFTEVAQPFQQLVKLAGPTGIVQPTNLATLSTAGFAPMNWAEAKFNGFNIASLENNRGDFVQPTATSLDSAIADATVNADGSLAFNYSGPGSAASYPMPDLIYAAVSKAPQTASNVDQERSVLSSILDVTGGAHTADLPAGFVPLPSALYHQAQNDLTADIVKKPTSPGSGSSGKGTGSGSGTTTKTTSGAPGSAASGSVTCASCLASASGFLFNDNPASGPQGSGPQSTGHPRVTGGHPSTSRPPPVAAGVLLAPTANRLLLPSLGVLGLAVLLWGLLLLSPPARRRVVAALAAFWRGLSRLFGRAKPAPTPSLSSPGGGG